MSMKEKIQIFLTQNYPNPNTREVAAIALKRIEHLNKIDINKINEIYNNIPKSALSNSSKNTELAFIKKFIKVLGTANNTFYNEHQLIKFENDSKPKATFTATELDLILKELQEFNNREFELIFKLLLHNGCRLGEFVKIPWNEMKKYNFEYSFKASKNGNYRSIFVPEELQPILEEVKITYAYKSIQNLFKNFEIFFKSKHPDFKKRITAHILRAQLITNMHMRGLNLGEIQCATGHVNQAVISSRYIKTNSNYHKQLLEIGNMDPLEALNVQKMKSEIKTLTQQISVLKIDFISKDNLIKEQQEIINKYKNLYGELQE